MKSGAVGEMEVPSWLTLRGVSDILSEVLDVWPHQAV